jgi:hypothetical protein
MAAGNAPLDSFRTGGAISGVGTPERLDTRQGYSTGPKPTPEEVEAYNKVRAARLATVRHPMELKREIAERETRAEADWLAIDHRKALRAAHAELAPVREDVARLRAEPRGLVGPSVARTGRSTRPTMPVYNRRLRLLHTSCDIEQLELLQVLGQILQLFRARFSNSRGKRLLMPIFDHPKLLTPLAISPQYLIPIGYNPSALRNRAKPTPV